VTQGARRRILILAPFPPGALPPHGGAVAIAKLVRSLSRRNAVTLAYLRAEDETSADPSLADCCDAIVEGRRPGVSVSSIRPLRRVPQLLPSVLTGHPLWVASRWSSDFAALIVRTTRSFRPQIVQAEFSAMGVYFSAVRGAGARTVVTFHDAETSSAQEHAAHATGLEWLMWRTEAALWGIYDRRLMRSVDAAIALTARDADMLSRLKSGAPITTIPLGVDMSAGADPLGGCPPLLLFVGNFNHPPNVDAAHYLLDEVFPRLRLRRPRLEVALVGENPPPWLRARAGGGVRVTGFVHDLQPIMNAATVFVAPLRRGGGMRIKVLEALAAGKATVGTSLAFEGTGVVDGCHALVAHDTSSFCASVELLLEDSARRKAIGEAARAHATAALSWDRTAAAYEAVYDRLLSVAR
jgi:glycosyltransferase involved in cell wall biosynthesis